MVMRDLLEADLAPAGKKSQEKKNHVSQFIPILQRESNKRFPRLVFGRVICVVNISSVARHYLWRSSQLGSAT